jgi:Concanavalin A-like lectin/glucanases superfamily
MLHLQMMSTGAMKFGFYSNDIQTGAGVFTAGKWHHVAYRYNLANGARVIYLDGALAASEMGATAFNGSTVGRIGESGDDGGFWWGKIDEVRIYNRALSATEVKQLYNAGR